MSKKFTEENASRKEFKQKKWEIRQANAYAWLLERMIEIPLCSKNKQTFHQLSYWAKNHGQEDVVKSARYRFAIDCY